MFEYSNHFNVNEIYMLVYGLPRNTPPKECPYLEREVQSLSVFWATEISASETDELLSMGWRKFGEMNFRPNCGLCQKCTPLRVKTLEFFPSKSQRRIFKKNHDITHKFADLVYDKSYFDLYLAHSKSRFNKDALENESEFKESFFKFTGQQMMSLFYLADKLVAFGILEVGNTGLSSVYFVFDPEFHERNLGTYGALIEIEYAKNKNLSYYYLGYWIAENQSLNYKANFKPYEIFDWNTKIWT